jgi:hypothetical protein
MPSEAVLAALYALLNVVGRLQLRTALLGGLALAVWKYPRFTKDVDVLVALRDIDKRRLLAELGLSSFRPKRGDGTVRVGELELLQMLYTPPGALIDVQVDLLLAGDDYQHAALDRAVSAVVAEFEKPINVLSCEDVVIHKLLAGRIIDRADASALLRANRESLDFKYMLHWIDEKKIAAEFAEVWREAFPGEPVPTLVP